MTGAKPEMPTGNTGLEAARTERRPSWGRLRTVAWLRWRLWQRRWHREGALLRGLGVLVTFLAVVVGGLSFLLAFVGGIAVLPDAEPKAVVVTWAVLIVSFLVVRVIGVLGGLQLGEELPLDRFLHLPFAPLQVYALNFVLSQLTLSTVVFLPAFLGLAVACTIALDVRNAVLVPASLALALCVAALVYQLQGWLLGAVVNRRRRAASGYLLLTVALLGMQAVDLSVRHERQAQREAAEAVAKDARTGQ